MNNRRQRVLLADDSKYQSADHESYLKKQGFAVMKAETGEEALQLARTLQPDMVVLGLLMATLEGIDVRSALRQDSATSDIPVVVLSGNWQTKLSSGCQALRDFCNDSSTQQNPAAWVAKSAPLACSRF